MNDSTSVKTEKVVAETIDHQSAAISKLSNGATVEQIIKAARLIDDAEGTVTFAGIGKSGDVADKIVSTFNSIGISSNFIHPVEALHGDLGVLRSDDIVVFISNSGNTKEMVELFQFAGQFNPTTIAITSDPMSKLAQRADHHIDTRVNGEGSVVDMVPMASTTATIVVGDCIANALMKRMGFTKDDFGHFHPSGTIGKRLLLDVGDLLYPDIPRTQPNDTLAEVALKMSKGGKGIAVVQNDNGRVLGILTDGDIRRLLQNDTDLHSAVAESVMITDPITISADISAVKALETMEVKDISQLVVVDNDNVFEGVIHFHDIMEEGLAVDRD